GNTTEDVDGWPGLESSVTRHTLLPLIPTLGFAAHSYRRSTTMRHLQLKDPFLADLLGDLATQLRTFGGAENPFPINRIQHNVNIPATVLLADVMVPIVERHLAFAIHVTQHAVIRQMSQDQFEIP